MTPQTVTITQGVIKVVLKSDAKSLDEVVVTAMGISREKKALGYAVQDVKSDQLTRAANTDLAGALQGKVSGVDIAPSSGMPGASSRSRFAVPVRSRATIHLCMSSTACRSLPLPT